LLNLSTIAEKAFRFAGATESTSVRRYQAASNNRLVGDWNSSNLSANQEIKDDLRTLRSRSRQLSRDSDYFIGFRRKMETYVIGEEGLKLQVDAKFADGKKKEDLNRKVEDQFNIWSRKEICDVTGQSSMRDMAALALVTMITDGEFLIRKVFTAEGLKLQMLDVDWLDEDFNDPKLQNGNRVVMSVELDQYDKPVAYYFSEPRWSAASTFGINPIVPMNRKRVRIPAGEIIHRFIKERAGQVRGVPWAHGAMLTLNQLDGFDEAELVGARVAASNMAFVSPPAEADGGPEPENPLDTEVSPGQVLELPAGYTVHEFNPTKPQESHFPKRMLRKVAASLGIDYSDMSNDLESVNFSSIRAGTINARDGYRILQKWIATNLYQDVYVTWLMTNPGLVTASQLMQVMYPIWRPRGFDWVDPSKDVKADVDAVLMGFKTRTEIAANHGKDFEEMIDQLAAEQAYIDKKGLKFGKDGAPEEKEGSDDEPAAGKAKKAGAK
jgi:lambda family phage portal protein